MRDGEAIILKNKSGCHSKKVADIDLTFYVHLLGAYVHRYMYKIYEVYDKACGQEDCPQTTTTLMMHQTTTFDW